MSQVSMSIPSRSTPGSSHEVTMINGIATCTCRSYHFRHSCAHCRSASELVAARRHCLQAAQALRAQADRLEKISPGWAQCERIWDAVEQVTKSINRRPTGAVGAKKGE